MVSRPAGVTNILSEAAYSAASTGSTTPEGSLMGRIALAARSLTIEFATMSYVRTCAPLLSYVLLRHDSAEF